MSVLCPEERRSAIARLEQIVELQENYYSFVKAAWPVVESDKFVSTWYGELLTGAMQESLAGHSKLLVNIPPRTGKSSIMSVFFTPWVWTTKPWIRFLYVSHSKTIATKHSRKCRMLLESHWYRSRWSHVFEFAKDQNAKSYFANDKLGSRDSASVGASITGDGADFVILDDPNDLLESYSDAKTEAALECFTGVLQSRLNSKGLNVMMVTQQRVKEADISGYILKNEPEKWKKLIIPMEYYETNSDFKDPRKKEGELLAPELFSKERVKEFKTHLQDLYHGQYQQTPVSREGAIFEKSWFGKWKKAKVPKLIQIIQSWDTAYKDKEHSDFSVCTTWGLFNSNELKDEPTLTGLKDSKSYHCLILLSLWKGKVKYPELRKRALRLTKNYTDTREVLVDDRETRKPDVILIEDKSSGQSLVPDLINVGLTNIHPRKPVGSKLTRAHLVSPLVENGLIYLPYVPDDFEELRPSAKTFLEQIILFPRSQNDDIVDSFTQALQFLKETEMLRITYDKEPPEPEVNEQSRYY